MPIYSCTHCSLPTSNSKFCSKSCSASHNNKGVRRHGSDPRSCLTCGSQTKSHAQKFCSRTCFGVSRVTSDEHKRKLNAQAQSQYRAKKYRVLAPTADKKKIKEIYLNCPEGHEVDHIIPLSRGGLHHQDNLQYLLKEDNRRKNNRIWYPHSELNRDSSVMSGEL